MGLRPKPPAKGYKLIRVPNFVTKDDSGRIREIRCKICGKVITSVRTSVINRVIEGDGRIIEQVETRLAYNSEYMEMVISLEQGMNHVTQGCRTCLAGKLKPEELAELVKCDLDEQGYEAIAPEDYKRRIQRKASKGSVFDSRKLGITA